MLTVTGTIGSNIHVLSIRSEARPGDGKVIGIERNIRDAEFPRTVGGGGALESR